MRIKYNFLSGLLVLLLVFFPLISSFGGIITYTYDKMNRLTKIAYDNGVNEEYTYDLVGNRLRHLVSPAASVTTCPATNVTPNSATLNGSVNPNGLLTDYYFQWGLTTSYGNVTSPQTQGSGTSNVAVSTNLSGLQPITTYHYRLVAYNNGGTSIGSDMTFLTLGTPIPWLLLLLGD